MLGVNVFAADTDEEARRLFTSLQQAFVNLRRGRPGPLPPPVDDFESRLDAAGASACSTQMLACSVVGSPETVRRGLEAFVDAHRRRRADGRRRRSSTTPPGCARSRSPARSA